MRGLCEPVELASGSFLETIVVESTDALPRRSRVESIVVDHLRGDHRCAACASLRSSPWVSS